MDILTHIRSKIYLKLTHAFKAKKGNYVRHSNKMYCQQNHMKLKHGLPNHTYCSLSRYIGVTCITGTCLWYFNYKIGNMFQLIKPSSRPDQGQPLLLLPLSGHDDGLISWNMSVLSKLMMFMNDFDKYICKNKHVTPVWHNPYIRRRTNNNYTKTIPSKESNRCVICHSMHTKQCILFF